jgi:thiamine biosynthesis lipoprotein
MKIMDGLPTVGDGRRIRSGCGRKQSPRARVVASALVSLACSTGLTLAAANRALAEWHSREIDLMGTRVSVELWHEDAAVATELIERVLGEYRRIDMAMSTYRPDSEISRINAGAAERAVPIGAELIELIGISLAISESSGGAFDISYDSVGYMYDFRAGRHPDEAAIAAAIDAIDYRQIVLDRAEQTIRFGKPGMRINLGGIAKGYAVEQGAKILRAAGIEHALLNAGGDTRVIGDRLGMPWIVGIRHPRTEGEFATRLPLVDEAISTSGDYERFFEENGRRYHHIINPQTGEPTTTTLSATVIGPDATITDGLSTTVFVLGAADGIALIERAYPGYETIVVDPEGRLHFSRGLVAPGP